MSMNFLQLAYELLYSSPEIDEGLFVTLPFPVLREEKRWIVLAGCECKGPPSPDRAIYPPRVVAYIDYPNAKKLDIVNVTPNDVGMPKNAADKPAGTWKEMSHLKHGEYTELDKQYEVLLLKVLTNQWLSQNNGNAAEQREVAKAMDNVLKKLTPPFLKEYYQWAGAELLAWIKQNQE